MAKSDQVTHLSASTQIVGDIALENDIRVAGTVQGKIQTTGALIVELSGKINGEVKSASATIAGEVVGNMECEERLVLESKAKFHGDIRTRQLVIEEGALFQGNCDMGEGHEGQKT
jgi:cytoskeletal protein CcmA (bactofilin family)